MQCPAVTSEPLLNGGSSTLTYDALTAPMSGRPKMLPERVKNPVVMPRIYPPPPFPGPVL